MLASVTEAIAQPAPVPVDECIRLALARSPVARAAGFDVGVALARVRAARAAYAPRLSVRGEYGRSAGFDDAVTNGGSTAALLTVESSLFDGGLRDAEFAAATARLRSAAALEQQRRADVAYAVRTAYCTAVAADRQARIHRETQDTLREYVTLLRRQELVGVVTRNDVLRAQLAADAATAAERAANAERDIGIDELNLLTDTALTPALLLDPGMTAFTPAALTAVEASPMVMDAQAAVEVAGREVDAVRSEWRTHVQFTAGGGALGVTPDHTFRDNGGAEFLVGLSLPLYDGGGTAARVAAADAVVHSSEASLQGARQTVSAALARAAVEARHAASDLTAWRKTIPQAAENFTLMRARYFGGGNVRLLEVLDALAQYAEARLAERQATFAYQAAIARQQQIVGEVMP